MAISSKATCDDNSASLDELASGILVKNTNDDVYGIRTVIVEVDESDLEGIGCDNVEALHAGDIVKQAIGLSSDSKPALILYVVETIS
jgi:hypothetical protein